MVTYAVYAKTTIKTKRERLGKEREERTDHKGKTSWDGERSGHPSWNVRPGTPHTHPEKAQMAAVKKKKINVPIPAADQSAVSAVWRGIHITITPAAAEGAAQPMFSPDP